MDLTAAGVPEKFAELGLTYDDVLLLPGETDLVPSEIDTVRAGRVSSERDACVGAMSFSSIAVRRVNHSRAHLIREDSRNHRENRNVRIRLRM